MLLGARERRSLAPDAGEDYEALALRFLTPPAILCFITALPQDYSPRERLECRLEPCRLLDRSKVRERPLGSEREK